jgi:hypothetical protein
MALNDVRIRFGHATQTYNLPPKRLKQLVGPHEPTERQQAYPNSLSFHTSPSHTQLRHMQPIAH